MGAMAWEDVAKSEQGFVLNRMHEMRRDAERRARRSDTHGNDFEQCMAELAAVGAAIEKLEAST